MSTNEPCQEHCHCQQFSELGSVWRHGRVKAMRCATANFETRATKNLQVWSATTDKFVLRASVLFWWFVAPSVRAFRIAVVSLSGRLQKKYCNEMHMHLPYAVVLRVLRQFRIYLHLTSSLSWYAYGAAYENKLVYVIKCWENDRSSKPHSHNAL